MRKMPQYAPEPWDVCEDGKSSIGISTLDGKKVISQKMDYVDANRVVECVNACAGIADPAEAKAQIDETEGAIRRALAALAGRI